MCNMCNIKEKVSVIIPTYKRSEFLERSVLSVINQTYSNIEVIIVDDNDENSEYRKENERRLKNLLDKYNNIFYLKHKKNLNGASARNTGIKFATGVYITFLDDDDFFLPSRIEKMVKVLASNTGYDGAYSSSLLINHNQKFLKTYRASKSGNFQQEMLRQKNFLGTGSNIFLRKKIVDEIGLFDETFFRHQDVEYMVRFFNYSDIIGINEILVVKCCEDNLNVPNFEKMLLIKEKFLNKFEIEIAGDKSIYFDNYLELMYLFIDNKNYFRIIYQKLKHIHPISFSLKLKILYRKYFKILPPFSYIAKLRAPAIMITEDEQNEIFKFLNAYYLSKK